MTADQIFAIANIAVLPFWALLAVAPGWRGTHLVVHSVAAPIVLALIYVWLVATGAFTDAPEGAGFSSLEGLMKLFTVPQAVVAGWVHYLVFDLFVGAWEVRDARRRGVPHLAVVPCLVLTLLAGPAGLLLYLAIRAGLGKGGWALDQDRP